MTVLFLYDSTVLFLKESKLYHVVWKWHVIMFQTKADLLGVAGTDVFIHEIEKLTQPYKVSIKYPLTLENSESINKWAAENYELVFVYQP